MNSIKKMLKWILVSTNGGENRYKILSLLIRQPMNAHELSVSLNMSYKTVRHHLSMLEKHGLISDMGNGYGNIFFSSEFLDDNLSSFNDVVEIYKNNTKKCRQVEST